jgi:signal transduction histidine kinase
VTLAGIDAEHVRVAVQDDGVGFDSTTHRAATHGLIGMRYRVEAEGGSMRLESTPGKGTLIEAILPVTDIDSLEATIPLPEAMPA